MRIFRCADFAAGHRGYQRVVQTARGIQARNCARRSSIYCAHRFVRHRVDRPMNPVATPDVDKTWRPDCLTIPASLLCFEVQNITRGELPSMGESVACQCARSPLFTESTCIHTRSWNPDATESFYPKSSVMVAISGRETHFFLQHGHMCSAGVKRAARLSRQSVHSARQLEISTCSTSREGLTGMATR